MALLLLSGLTFASVVPAVTMAQDLALVRSSPRDPFGREIAEAANRFNIPTAWIRAVMQVESDNRAGARSAKGARGLMQIMPETWLDLRLRHHLGTDPFDPHDNILAGTAYLRELYDRYGSPGFLAAYNAGPARYEDYLAGRSLPAETRAYVARLHSLTGSIAGAGGMPTTASMFGASKRSWKRATLFVALSDGNATSVSLPAKRPRNDGLSISPVQAAAPVMPRPTGLFAAQPLARNSP